MATGVASWSTTAATNASADSAVNWAEQMAPSAVNDSARNEMASVAKWRDDISGSLTTGGTSTAYTVTSNQSFASLTALNGHMLYIKMSATSGASPTLAVDGLTAKALTTNGSTAVPTGSLISGSIWGVTYSSSDGAFTVHAAPPTAGSFTSLTVSGLISAGSASVTGSTTIGTTLSVGGDFAIATNKFTVASASGNTVVAGTLNVTGAAVLSSSLSALSATGSVVATQAEQATGTSTTTLVSPGRQHFHLSAAKFWLNCDADGNNEASFNIASINDTGAGIVDVTIATDFSSAEYVAVICTQGNGNTMTEIDNTTPPAAGTIRLRAINAATAGSADPSEYHVVGFGTSA